MNEARQIVKPKKPRLPSYLDASTIIPAEVTDETRFERITTSDDDLRGISATEVTFDESRIERMNLNDAQLLKLSMLDTQVETSDLANMIIRGSSFIRSVFSGTRMTGVDWAESSISDVEFANCQMDLCSFRFVNLKRVKFSSCSLRNSDFQGAKLSSVAFDGCDFEGGDLSAETYTRTEFRRCHLENIKGVEKLRGTRMEWSTIVGLAGEFAVALGISAFEE